MVQWHSHLYVCTSLGKYTMVMELMSYLLCYIHVCEYIDNIYFSGKVVGAFYDSEGKPTEALHAAEKHIIKAYENKAIFDKEKEIFPPCNSQFKPADNIKRVWCHPRRYVFVQVWSSYIPILL